MQKSRKAALLSALIFPGIGQFYLQRRILGAVLAGAAIAAIYRIISVLLEQAREISVSIQRGDIAPSITSIIEALATQPVNGSEFLSTLAWAVLVIAWLISIADAYLRS
ncbi:hypothetical protein N9N07_00545 [Pseudomonadales bacterium]|jgi:hypothetical protein|nr:hypothetical protein [Pseudomonadales bacterium]MDB4362774.1 hypothetical protein [Pseudomonadales bacterium]MDB4404662.1 hypothetical protein [bacterium]MDB4542542.1 hypothetical protein [Pseudomonadales bacterium]